MENLTQEQRKLQVIKDAYEKFYEQCKPDKNGWTCLDNADYGHLGILRKDIEYFPLSYVLWRPLSLKGIEDNNGWKAIESKANLPTERGMYWVIDKFMHQNPSMIVFFDPNYSETTLQRWLHRYTHYQKIQLPLDKLY